MIRFYDGDHAFTPRVGTFETRADVVDSDTFTETAKLDESCFPALSIFAAAEGVTG